MRVQKLEYKMRFSPADEKKEDPTVFLLSVRDGCGCEVLGRGSVDGSFQLVPGFAASMADLIHHVASAARNQWRFEVAWIDEEYHTEEPCTHSELALSLESGTVLRKTYVVRAKRRRKGQPHGA